MNSSINYSGFVDLLKKSPWKTTHSAEAKKDEGLEPGREVSVQLPPDSYHAMTEVAAKYHE